MTYLAICRTPEDDKSPLVGTATLVRPKRHGWSFHQNETVDSGFRMPDTYLMTNGGLLNMLKGPQRILMVGIYSRMV